MSYDNSESFMRLCLRARLLGVVEVRVTWDAQQGPLNGEYEEP
jgi:hypothetical protein